jgi:hypothetical protein
MSGKMVGLAIALIAGLTGCGSPMLSPAATESLRDPGLAGEWAAADPMEIRAAISPADQVGGPYVVALTVHDHGEFRTALRLELIMTEVGGTRYADLFLARSERDKLVGSHGFLVVPVHQVMRAARDGDTLTVWPFRGDGTGDGSSPSQRVTVGAGEVSLVTASTDRIRETLARHGGEAGSFGDPIVFQRVGRLR